eukprot:3614827-Prymnesium_polylepis.1
MSASWPSASIDTRKASSSACSTQKSSSATERTSTSFEPFRSGGHETHTPLPSRPACPSTTF